jgi:hypothetical protein
VHVKVGRQPFRVELCQVEEPCQQNLGLPFGRNEYPSVMLTFLFPQDGQRLVVLDVMGEDSPIFVGSEL